MAMRASTYWKSMLTRLRGSSSSASTFATSTSPKMKTYAPTASFGHFQENKPRAVVRGEFVPVYVALGMIMLSTTLGLYTGSLQLRYSPNVRLRKSRREKLPEVEEPEIVVDEASKLIHKSFFRKVAHVQDLDRHHLLPADPFLGDVFAREPRVETLKSVGVEGPNQHKI